MNILVWIYKFYIFKLLNLFKGYKLMYIVWNGFWLEFVCGGFVFNLINVKFSLIFILEKG